MVAVTWAGFLSAMLVYIKHVQDGYMCNRWLYKDHSKNDIKKGKDFFILPSILTDWGKTKKTPSKGSTPKCVSIKLHSQQGWI